jgi:hypothetical protein
LGLLATMLLHINSLILGRAPCVVSVDKPHAFATRVLMDLGHVSCLRSVCAPASRPQAL